MNIYVGNIPREATENAVREEFEQYGEVSSVSLIKDKYTNMLKGFGFVEMPKTAEAQKAIENLDGSMLNGRPLTVNPAKPKTENSNNNSSRRYNSRY
ncbi:MAG: RNA-binding protein [Ignavibacteriae bacterium]|nr:MAG: RNA-binding protein [Ignavibacteriota bacterium]